MFLTGRQPWSAASSSASGAVRGRRTPREPARTGAGPTPSGPGPAASRASSRWAMGRGRRAPERREARAGPRARALGRGDVRPTRHDDAPGQASWAVIEGAARALGGSLAMNSIRSAVMKSPPGPRPRATVVATVTAWAADHASAGPRVRCDELGQHRSAKPLASTGAALRANTTARSPSTMAASWRLRMRSARPAAVLRSWWAVSKSPNVGADGDLGAGGAEAGLQLAVGLDEALDQRPRRLVATEPTAAGSSRSRRTSRRRRPRGWPRCRAGRASPARGRRWRRRSARRAARWPPTITSTAGPRPRRLAVDGASSSSTRWPVPSTTVAVPPPEGLTEVAVGRNGDQHGRGRFTGRGPQPRRRGTAVARPRRGSPGWRR